MLKWLVILFLKKAQESMHGFQKRIILRGEAAMLASRQRSRCHYLRTWRERGKVKVMVQLTWCWWYTGGANLSLPSVCLHHANLPNSSLSLVWRLFPSAWAASHSLPRLSFNPHIYVIRWVRWEIATSPRSTTADLHGSTKVRTRPPLVQPIILRHRTQRLSS